ncbi:unnamed protein product [Vitrella brassicaformis CCMP3155]|uniref:CS domain-containing protein n=1 Tax=Vitrella brassicaformis (strain CCMP3155) TaxID=1169540 RepID=A0A0G4EVF1_VITBC|nr:unnamed protein product [Vitrella brassicaformis CCMP3155]|eukprot:CEM02381.1 unnamed protein product [Vitrella brassicaformis CCMP3155]
MAVGKVHVHYEEQGHAPWHSTAIFDCQSDDLKLGTLKQAFITHFNDKVLSQPSDASVSAPPAPLKYEDWCLTNHQHAPMPDAGFICTWVDPMADIFIRPVAEFAAAQDTAIQDNIKKKGELSYYYAHGAPASRSIVSKTAASVSVSAPPPQQLEQKPDLGSLHYTTISTFTWEDASDTVRVKVPLDGIGKHPRDKIISEFEERSCQLFILDFNGKNYRFRVPKLQCKIDAAASKHVVKESRVTLFLRKVKDDDYWHSLFYTKGIGE